MLNSEPFNCACGTTYRTILEIDDKLAPAKTTTVNCPTCRSDFTISGKVLYLEAEVLPNTWERLVIPSEQNADFQVGRRAEVTGASGHAGEYGIIVGFFNGSARLYRVQLESERIVYLPRRNLQLRLDQASESNDTFSV